MGEEAFLARKARFKAEILAQLKRLVPLSSQRPNTIAEHLIFIVEAAFIEGVHCEPDVTRPSEVSPEPKHRSAAVGAGDPDPAALLARIAALEAAARGDTKGLLDRISDLEAAASGDTRSLMKQIKDLQAKLVETNDKWKDQYDTLNRSWKDKHRKDLRPFKRKKQSGDPPEY